MDVLTDTPDLYRSGTYRFDDLETAGLRTVNGTDQWVVYGYKVRVSDPRVTENELFKAKYQLTGAGYRENSDLTGDNALVEPDEYIVLLETVAEDGTTPTGSSPTSRTLSTRRRRTTTTRRRTWSSTRTANRSWMRTTRRKRRSCSPRK